MPFLQPGRLVYLKTAESWAGKGRPLELGWAVVLNFRRKFAPASYAVDVLLPIKRVEPENGRPAPVAAGAGSPRAPPQQPGNLVPVFLGAEEQEAVAGGAQLVDAAYAQMTAVPTKHHQQKTVEGSFHIVSVLVSMIHVMSQVRLYLPPDLRTQHAKATVWAAAVRALQSFPVVPTVSSEDILQTMRARSAHLLARPPTATGMGMGHMSVSSGSLSQPPPPTATMEDAARISKRLASLEQRLGSCKAVVGMDKETLATAKRTHDAHLVVAQRVAELKKKAGQSLVLKYETELKQRMRVLRRLGHISEGGLAPLLSLLCSRKPFFLFLHLSQCL